MARNSDVWDRFQTAMADQDVEGIASVFAPDAVYLALGVRHEGRDGIRQWLGGWVHAFSDVRFETSVVVEDGDVTIAEWTYYGVQSGQMTMGNGLVVPASGRVLDSTGVTVMHTRDGQVIHARDYSDQLDDMAKLGLLPNA